MVGRFSKDIPIVDGSVAPTDSDPAVVVKVSGGAGPGGATQVEGNVAAGVADSGNPVKTGGIYTAAAPVLVDGNRGNTQLDQRGNLKISIWHADGAVGADVVNGAGGDAAGNAVDVLFTRAYAMIWNGTTWDRLVSPNATSRIVSAAASTNATVAKASAGRVFTITGRNVNAAARFLKIYNKATAPVVGTDTPTHTIPLAPTANFSFSLEGRYFSTGIAYALTTGVADADAGALTAGDIIGLNIDYA